MRHYIDRTTHLLTIGDGLEKNKIKFQIDLQLLFLFKRFFSDTPRRIQEARQDGEKND